MKASTRRTSCAVSMSGKGSRFDGLLLRRSAENTYFGQAKSATESRWATSGDFEDTVAAYSM